MGDDFVTKADKVFNENGIFYYFLILGAMYCDISFSNMKFGSY